MPTRSQPARSQRTLFLPARSQPSPPALTRIRRRFRQLTSLSTTLSTTVILVASIGVFATTSLQAQAVEDEAAEETNAEVAAVPRMAVDDEGRVVNFQRDIAPIFRENCLECHGPDDAKNDFRIDDPDSVMDYVDAEDASVSSLYVDYMTTEDDDMLMPPRSHGGPLSAGQLALVRLWIDEGADWPEDAMLDGGGAPLAAVDTVAVENMSLPSRVWSFQGFLHPATVHFPIALLVIGALFVVLGWKWEVLGTQIPLACLLIGAASSIAATMMGWSFSVEKGYGSWNRVDFDATIFWHRWSAVIVTVAATLFAIIALVSLKKNSARLTTVWKVGLLVVAGLVGAVGHQGGELTYGKEFYPKAFSILLGQPIEKVKPAIAEIKSMGIESSSSAETDETAEE